MNNFLGMSLKIRSMIHMAAEPIPFFWPMRTFIHHNPLHGLEHLPFPEAVEQGSKLFHGRAYLPRSLYQAYLDEGKVDRNALAAEISAFLAGRENTTGLALPRWLLALLTETRQPVSPAVTLPDAADIHTVLTGKEPDANAGIDLKKLTTRLRQRLLADCPVYEAVDALYGTQLGEELDTLLIKSCLDFFDEGQSAWGMPGREHGFFQAWRELALHNIPLVQRTRQVRRILGEADTPEGIIAYVLAQLGIPEARWMAYFTRELARLHGWVGFIRWRSSAKRYHWNQKYPGDLIDFMAIRLTLALALLNSGKLQRRLNTRTALEAMITERPQETWLRLELYSGQILPVMANTVERALLRNKPVDIAAVFTTYTRKKRQHEARQQAAHLQELAQLAGDDDKLATMAVDEIQTLLDTLSACEQREGMMWLRAMEAKAITRLLDGVTLRPCATTSKRPFAQALFCIDTRSERIRRHLESVGDYQTFGIAGFFGVPLSFMELGKGSELHLCPVILTPQNLVLEIAATGVQDDPAMTALEHAVHELKESVLTPFVTVEAIGLLFGFDMIGKTLAPRGYHNWRKRLHAEHPHTHLLLDKLSRTEADSIVRTVQRAVIVKAIEQEFGLAPEKVTDAVIRELREAALDHQTDLGECLQHLGLGEGKLRTFIKRLQTDYRINASSAQWQLERLGRIGFTLDEQTNYVGTALRAIGLTENFSRFVLLVGHGSTSANNPYESALDCGACGGNHGQVSGRVLAQMANKPQVRRRLHEQGIDIPDDTWFVPALHNTTTDEVQLIDLELVPSAHLMYLDRLRKGLTAASRLCAQERIPTLGLEFYSSCEPASAFSCAQRNAVDWSQVRPEWGLSRNAYFIIGRRGLTSDATLDGRAFLHSYDYRVDPKRRLLENILTGPLVVGQWINMEHYFSTVDNDRFGSGSKVNHNVAGRFGVMTGNISDLRTGLPAQTVLKKGKPYHEPVRLVTLIEAPFEHARQAVERVISVKRLVKNAWIRLLVIDPETHTVHLFEDGSWQTHQQLSAPEPALLEEALA
ncbi:DUF2309 domain-containing protein [Thiothrix nivea]|uniref:Probable inorganic carbon transporter subunit DabA n=1 Tax=Thiothrix nivea (strain ATCC 35100 / DSM 5205 / JP2) TaxID=870187 RepID=A0A656HG06_THINJ|nr:DUF2309 domain-containing protein [Thiothrix nivea]EIJ34436.1 UPF0753 protein [Thiothrix nivea DSM 5205]